MSKVVYKKLSYKITGLLFKTHHELGRYRNEKQYADFFEELLRENNIEYEREYRFVDKQYSEKQARCICDFIVEEKIIIEFKAKSFITRKDYYQIRRYLDTLNLELGLLVNFHAYRLSPKRVLNSNFLKNDSEHSD